MYIYPGAFFAEGEGLLARSSIWRASKGILWTLVDPPCGLIDSNKWEDRCLVRVLCEIGVVQRIPSHLHTMLWELMYWHSTV